MTRLAATVLHSMTGYARTEGQDMQRGVSWVWDLRSVNGKGLDLRCRFPNGYEALEKPVRDRVSAAIGRGSVNLTLTVTRVQAAVGLRLNTQWLETLIQEGARCCVAYPGQVTPPSFDGLLQVKGVVEAAEAVADDALDQDLLDRMMADADAAIVALVAARHDEGARIAAVVSGQVQTIADLVDRAEASAAARPEAQKARLQRQLAELLETSSLPEDRLMQELALMATRYDVREELDRLRSHIIAAQDLLALGRNIGRKFDFLCQEFNREANTLCSKAADADLTAIGLDLKTMIDRLREQIQNIE